MCVRFELQQRRALPEFALISLLQTPGEAAGCAAPRSGARAAGLRCARPIRSSGERWGVGGGCWGSSMLPASPLLLFVFGTRSAECYGGKRPVCGDGRLSLRSLAGRWLHPFRAEVVADIFTAFRLPSVTETIPDKLSSPWRDLIPQGETSPGELLFTLAAETCLACRAVSRDATFLMLFL